MNKNNTYINWKNWNEDSFSKTSNLEKAYFLNIFKLLKLKSTAKILEIGFGNGAFLGYAVSKKFHCDGVETNESLVDLAVDKNFSAYKALEEINQNTKYDLIVLFDVIEHIHADKIESFFSDLSFYLQDSGSIFLRFPNGSSPLGLANQHGDITHCNIVTLPKLNYWCYNSNLKVVFSRGDTLPFIFNHNLLKMPSRLIKLFFHLITERFIRLISSQSKGVLSSNLQAVIKKI